MTPPFWIEATPAEAQPFIAPNVLSKLVLSSVKYNETLLKNDWLSGGGVCAVRVKAHSKAAAIRMRVFFINGCSPAWRGDWEKRETSPGR